MATIERSADLTVIGANGGAWCTDLGAAVPTRPTTLTAALPAGLYAMGAISDDGLTYAFDEDNEQFQAWGQLAPFRTEITRSTRTFQLTLWETNRPIVKSVMYRLPVADVTADETERTYAFAETSAPTPDRRTWLIDVIDGASLERFFVPHGEVTDRDDVTFRNDEMSGFNITITAYPDVDNVTVYHLGQVGVLPTGLDPTPPPTP